MMKRILKLLAIAAVAVLPVASGCGGDEAETDHYDVGSHSGHVQTADEDHGAESVEAGDHDAESHEGHDHDEGAEGVLHLSPESMRLAGIQIKRLTRRNLGRMIELPGEIGFNEDRLVHVTPRYPGVARDVKARVGTWVKEGDVLAVLESNESLTKYSIRAPISGWIIDKHLSAGEFVSEDHNMFIIADLRTVWANCEVYPKDLSWVKQGSPITIHSLEDGPLAETVISYVAPVYREDTRSALARAVIDNESGTWRPGSFIRATLPAESEGERTAVERDAVQVLEGEQVVFVPGEEEGEFMTAPVTTGVAGDGFIEIVDGLSPGEAYVARGAFELKASMVTANLDPHAGHGH